MEGGHAFTTADACGGEGAFFILHRFNDFTHVCATTLPSNHTYKICSLTEWVLTQKRLHWNAS